MKHPYNTTAKLLVIEHLEWLKTVGQQYKDQVRPICVILEDLVAVTSESCHELIYESIWCGIVMSASIDRSKGRYTTNPSKLVDRYEVLKRDGGLNA